MKNTFYITALAPFVLAGCVVEQPVPVTSTEVHREVVTTTGPEVLVPQPPPTVRVETQTVSPGPRYVWQAGHWRWNGATYVWVPGHWVLAPRVGAVWVAGQWVRRPGGWVWVEGHWQ